LIAIVKHALPNNNAICIRDKEVSFIVQLHTVGPLTKGKVPPSGLEIVVFTRSSRPEAPPILIVEIGIFPSKIRTSPFDCHLAVQEQLGDVKSVQPASSTVVLTCSLAVIHLLCRNPLSNMTTVVRVDKDVMLGAFMKAMENGVVWRL
jgi:hypothetical protein